MNFQFLFESFFLFTFFFISKGGVMNTHSRTADCRTELLCAHAALCGASRDVCAALMNAATTDACMEILDGCLLYTSRCV